MANELRPFLGGSDIAAVVGLSPWKTPIALWEEKRAALAGEAEPDTDTPVKARGRRWEPVAREMLLDALAERDMFCTVLATNTRLSDMEHEWMRAEIDVTLAPSGLSDVWNGELKTIGAFAARKDWGEEETDQIPVHYTAQAQWGLMVTGRKVCVVGALFGADRLRPYVVERDDDVIAWLRQEAIRFWNENVLANVCPAPMNLQDLAKLYPQSVESPMRADPYMTQRLMRLRALSAEIKAREAEWEALEFEIKSVMGANGTILIGREDRPAVTWLTQKRNSLDIERFKTEQPKLYKEYLKASESRVFLLKQFSIEGVMP